MKNLGKLLIIIFITLICGNAYSQDKIFDIFEKNYPAPGYLFIAPLNEKYLTLIDNSGYAVYDIPRGNYDQEIYDLKLHKNGLITYFDRAKNQFYSMDQNYKKLDSFRCTSQYFIDFHDIEFLSNGNYILLADENRTMNLKQYNDKYQQNALVVGAVIQEFNSNHQLVYEWNSFDHINVLDAENCVDFTQNQIRYAHPNSIDIDSDGNWIVSFRHLDAVVKINRSNGEIMWRLGGSKAKNTTFRITNDSTESGFVGFSHQHDARRTSSGNIIVFDNGNNREPQYSRVVEYRLDETNRTAEKVWEYRYSPDVFGPMMGSVQRLSNGNTLISWGNVNDNMLITEVRPDKSKAFEIISTGRIVYRAYRFMFKMDAVEKNITTTTTYDFNDSKYQTGVKIDVDSLSSIGKVTVEKHRYKPHNITFADEQPLLILPFRWVVNKLNATGMRGKIRFSSTNLPYVQSINDIIIYHRSIEGEGDFYKANILQVNSNANEVIAKYMGSGEYIVCLKNGPIPEPLLPADSSTSVPASGTMSWSNIDIAKSYTVQISRDPFFTLVDFEIDRIEGQKTDYQELLNYTHYYWRVAARFDYGLGAWSKGKSFTTIIARPTLNAPLNASYDVSTKGKLNWESTPGADRFNVQLSERQDFQTKVLDEYTSLTSITYSKLKSNFKYFWKVSSFRGNTSGGWSDVWEFTTTLEAPKQLSPVNLSAKMPLNFNLKWDKVSGADFYIIQVSDDPLFKSFTMEVAGFFGTSIATYNLKFNKTYYWRVRASNGASTGDWSDTWLFSTKLAPPEKLNPADNATGIPVSGYLTWEIVENAVKYETQIALDLQFNQIVETKTDITLLKSGYSQLGYLTKYYWRVRALSTTDTSDWSTVWGFVTVSESSLERPELHSPENLATGASVNVTLTWKPISKADYYTVQVSENPAFTFFNFDSSAIKTTSVTIKGLQNRESYFWRVRAFSNFDSSGWSDIWRFKTALPPPALVYPENNEDKIKLNPVLTWEAVEEALLYQVNVSSSENFDVKVFEQSVSTDYVMLPLILKSETNYFWRVNAIDKEGMSDWSNIWKFSTEKSTFVEPNFDGINRIRINPNPVNSVAFISFDLTEPSNIYLKISDICGKTIYSMSKQMQPQGSYNFEVPVEALIQGLYVFTLEINGKTSSGTFIKVE